MRQEDGIWYFSTSSANAFKRCRRKWYFRHVLGYTTPQNKYMWTGSCFHYVLEDYYGQRHHKTHMDAIQAFVANSKQEDLPDDLNHHIEQVMGMLENYFDYAHEYLPEDRYKTLIFNEEPQVEMKMVLDLGVTDSSGVPVHWRGTVDRVIEDDNGELWLVDYKTKSKVDTSLLDLDPQIGNYLLAAPYWLGRPVRGMIYIQCVRAKPQYPKVGKRGDVSVAKTQITTAGLYSQALIDVYGSVENAPDKQQEFLEGLILEEGVSGNRFIRVDRVYRNQEQLETLHHRLIAEAEDMLRAIEQQRLYPNPTRDCNWDCQFEVPCLMTDEQREPEEFLDQNFIKKEYDERYADD